VEALGERGTIRKKWKGRIPCACAYPNTYYVGMSNLAIHVIYRLLNGLDTFLCERVFLSERIVSVESGRPLGSFEIVFFSLSFELDYPNVIRMLEAARIQVSAIERREGPLIVAGGICAIMNPEPLHDIFDLFILGDAEATLLEFAKRYEELRGREREEIIDGLSELPYVYNPRRLSVAYSDSGLIEGFSPSSFSVEVKGYNGERLATSQIVTEDTEFSSMYLAEGVRGCPSRCPFCLTGHLHEFVYEPSLPPSSEQDIGIVGGGVSFHPHLYELVASLKRMGKRVHLPSLRLDAIPLSVIALLKDDIRTLAFGVEAGTERLRRFIGKPLKDEDILERLSNVFSIGPFNVKLYFMVGLHGEQKDDVEAIVDLTKRVRHVMVRECAKRGKIGTITVHVSPFVPKPQTPFQWLAMEEETELKRKVQYLERAVGRIGNAILTHESIKYSFIQALFSRGDRRVAGIVKEIARGRTLKEIRRESPLNPSFYVTRARDEGEILPWDFISPGRKERLLAELKRRLSGPDILSASRKGLAPAGQAEP